MRTLVSGLGKSNFMALDFLGAQETGWQNQNRRPIEKQLKRLFLVLYYISRPCGFNFEYISIKSFCNEAIVVLGSYLNVVLLSKIR